MLGRLETDSPATAIISRPLGAERVDQIVDNDPRPPRLGADLQDWDRSRREGYLGIGKRGPRGPGFPS